MTTAFIGLGANLGDRAGSLRDAVRRLAETPGLALGCVSSVYETAAVGVTDQPDFLNAVAEVQTSLTALDLLGVLLDIENKMGRVRTIRWGPRVIDLDLLLYGDAQIALPSLTVPHPRLAERAFVLVPLAEIAPETADKFLRTENFSGDGNIRRVGVVLHEKSLPHPRFFV